MKKKIQILLVILTVLLSGCSTDKLPTNKNIKYTPVDNKLLKDVEPYRQEPKPTLKDKIEQQRVKECRDEIAKRHAEDRIHGHQTSAFEEFLDSLSC